MAISKVLSRDEFVQMFDNYNRGDNFSRVARRHLYDYFWDLSEDSGRDYELDVIAICCEWSEYDEDDMLEAFSHIWVYDERYGDVDLDSLLSLLGEYTTIIHVPENNSYLVENY